MPGRQQRVYARPVAQWGQSSCAPGTWCPQAPLSMGLSQARTLAQAAISWPREISSIRRLNPCLLHCKVGSLPLSHLGSPQVTSTEQSRAGTQELLGFAEKQKQPIRDGLTRRIAGQTPVREGAPRAGKEHLSSTKGRLSGEDSQK